MNVTARTIGGWEAGTTVVPAEKQALLAGSLGFPSTFFALDDPAGTSVDAVSFRSLSRKSASQRDAALAMCDLAVELSEWLEPRFPRDSSSLPDLSGEHAELAADLLRREWGLGTAPISNLNHLLEAKGVRIFGLPDNCREIDACSFWLDGIPFILFDTTRSAERIRFNLAHELGHLVLHRHGAPIGQLAEKDANGFASSFLITIESIQRGIPRSINIVSILELKRKWGVSASALAYKLNKVGYLSDWLYKSMVIEMRRRNYHEVEPFPIAHEQSFVLDFILKELRRKGISLRQVASEVHLPLGEIVGLFKGLATLALEGHDIETFAEKRAKLRLVQSDA